MSGNADVVLVTGAAGFIGFHAALALLARGLRVIAADSFNDYYPREIKERRRQRLEGEGATFVVGDLAEPETVARAFAHTPGLVLHLAAQAGVRYSLINPGAYTQANVVALVNVLEAARQAGVERFVYASSSSVYGGNERTPFAEADRVDRPLSLYAATKRAGELIAYAYTEMHSLATVGLRFFTVYGPWGRPDMAMWIFAEKLLAGEPLPLFADGTLVRDFTYIDDIVAGIVAACFPKAPLAPFEVFNLGNHRGELVRHVVRLIEQHLGKTAQIEVLPMQPGDVRATLADIEHSRQALGYAPTTTLEVGIPRFLDWLKGEPELAERVRKWRRQATWLAPQA